MSQAEIETLRAVYEAISRGDWEAAFREASPDFEFIPPDQNPIAGTYRGGEAVRSFFAELWAAFEEVTIEPGPFLAADNSIVVSLLMILSPSGSGAKVEMRITHFWTLHNGRPVRCQVFLARDEALEAAGLSE
jgi:ketosteroid isomerase-like protein